MEMARSKPRSLSSYRLTSQSYNFHISMHALRPGRAASNTARKQRHSSLWGVLVCREDIGGESRTANSMFNACGSMPGAALVPCTGRQDLMRFMAS